MVALQKHFDLLKSIYAKIAAQSHDSHKKSVGGTGTAGPPALAVNVQQLDLARAFVGISKGNLQLGLYLVAINYDFTSLLDWKLSRADLIK